MPAVLSAPVRPARAGINRRSPASRPPPGSPTRTRRYQPPPPTDPYVLAESDPHAQVSTGATGRSVRVPAVRPARAGINRGRSIAVMRTAVRPARAGINRQSIPGRVPSGGPTRTRRYQPETAMSPMSSISSDPHAQVSTTRRHRLRRRCPARPARAGINRPSRSLRFPASGPTRTRRYQPSDGTLVVATQAPDPYAQVSTDPAHQHPARPPVRPSHAGINRDRRCGVRRTGRPTRTRRYQPQGTSPFTPSPQSDLHAQVPTGDCSAAGGVDAVRPARAGISRPSWRPWVSPGVRLAHAGINRWR